MVSAAARPPQPHGAPLPSRPAAAAAAAGGGEPRMARSPPAPAGHRGAWAQRGCAPVPPRRRRLRTVAARVPAAKLCAGWEAGARSRRGEGPPPPPPPPRARGARRAPPSAAPGGAGQRPGGPAGGAGESSEPRRGQQSRWPPVCGGRPPAAPHPARPAAPQIHPLGRSQPPAAPRGAGRARAPKGGRQRRLSSTNPSPFPQQESPCRSSLTPCPDLLPSAYPKGLCCHPLAPLPPARSSCPNPAPPQRGTSRGVLWDGPVQQGRGPLALAL
ncbi:proline-rich protein HaeIII subfamily 1-like [Haliaeetus albicilla]|uniref:proline-rich protein HaeIII subfamily 1-like n=1 Tax=Haliaeetus albicilla TaxID=8969 RepID=UPI0037E6FFB4